MVANMALVVYHRTLVEVEDHMQAEVDTLAYVVVVPCKDLALRVVAQLDCMVLEVVVEALDHHQVDTYEVVDYVGVARPP